LYSDRDIAAPVVEDAAVEAPGDRLVITHSPDPTVGAWMRRSHSPNGLGVSRDHRWAEWDRIQRRSSGSQMHVVIVKARDHCAALGIDDPLVGMSGEAGCTLCDRSVS